MADALSKSMKAIQLETVSTCETNINERVKSVQEKDAFFKTVKLYLEKEPIGLKYEGYQLLNDFLINYKGRLYIPKCDDLKRFIMNELHKSPYIGYPSYQKTITTTRKLFYWSKLKMDIENYLAKCI